MPEHTSNWSKGEPIVLAAFGCAQPDALQAILKVREHIQAGFPDHPVHLCFTSRMIRAIWRRRREDAAWRQGHPEAPEWVYRIQGPLALLAGLQDIGHRDIAVQSLHIYAGEEYQGLAAYINALAGITTIKKKLIPFRRLLLGRPALGVPGDVYPYREDLQAAAQALAPDLSLAREQNAALVYVGHGNEYFSSGAYLELREALKRAYPDTQVLVGVVEGFPSQEHVLAELKASGKKSVLLKPLMLAAGEHAKNDINGRKGNTWRNRLIAEGFQVDCRLDGLGENPAWAELYLNHLKDALASAR